MQFPIQDQYIHMSRERTSYNKIKLGLFLSLLIYICIGPELETAYKKATITALRQNISHGKEKGLDNRERKSERERENFIMFTLL